MSTNHKIASLFSILLAVPIASFAQGALREPAAFPGVGAAPAASRGAEPDLSGFYGGIARRDHGTESGSLSLGAASAAWSRYAAPAADDAARALFWGGYRWRNDLAVEAAFSSRDQYALKPDPATPARRGVGLQLAPDSGVPGDTAARSWNVDVFTSWSFYRSLALYGRMGYTQSESTSLYGPAPAVDSRRARDGMNYGVGLRYDMNSALGLRLEYGRFGRFTTEFSGGLPETDQVTLGVQLSF